MAINRDQTHADTQQFNKQETRLKVINMHKEPKYTKTTVAIFGAFALMSSSVAMAGSLTIPNTFSSGTAAVAAEVNANFAAGAAAVSDNDGRITTNAGGIETNTGGISTNAGNISTNAGGISTNVGNISTNTGGISTNAGNISTNTGGISTNTTAISGHNTRITALESGVSGGSSTGVSESSADNTAVSVNCSTDSLQAAIEAAPLHGKTVITISGACSDDIYIRRDGITIQGATGQATDSITGNLTGFSSDPDANFNTFGETTSALVQLTLSAAVEMIGRSRVVFKDMTINAGSNATAFKAARNSNIKLVNVTLNGGNNGFGLHVSNSDAIVKNVTATGSGIGIVSLFAGSGVLAENNSVIELLDGNIFTAGSTAEGGGLVALSNTTVRLTGSNNQLNASPGDEYSLAILVNSTLLQTVVGSGNQINGSVEISDGSSAFFQSIAIVGDTFELYSRSNVVFGPASANSITVTINNSFEIDTGSSLELGNDDGSSGSVTIGGNATTMRLLDHATLFMGSASVVDMNLTLHRGSSVDGFGNSKVTGNLEVNGFSVYVQTAQGDGESSVSGTVTCSKGEAFDFAASIPGTPIALGNCL